MGKLDWVLKLCMIERAIDQKGLRWGSPQVRHLDQIYSSLDAAEGLYWAYERAGVARTLVPSARIEHLVHEPPADTRAWLRAQVLRRVDPDAVVSVDWDEIRLRFPAKGSDTWSYYSYYRLPMGDPLGGTRQSCLAAFDQAESLQEALAALGMRETTWSGRALEAKPAPDTASGSNAASRVTGGDDVVVIRDVSKLGLEGLRSDNPIPAEGDDDREVPPEQQR